MQAFLWPQIFPRSVQTIQSLCGALGWDPNSAPLPTIPVNFTNNKKFMEVPFVARDEELGWGVIPGLEIPVGADTDEIPLPSDMNLCKEAWNLLRSVKEAPTWKAATICEWLRTVEEEPEDFEGDNWVVTYGNLDTANCTLDLPPIRWTSWSDPTPPREEKGETNNVPGLPMMMRHKGRGGVRKFSGKNKILDNLLASERSHERVQDPAIQALVASSLTTNTWRALGALERKVQACRRETKKPLHLPWSEDDWLIFLKWLSTHMTAASVRSNMNRLSTLHMVLGHSYSRPPILSRLLTGLDNSQILSRQSEIKKEEMNPALLRELRSGIKTRPWPLAMKRLFWCLALFMYYGCFRIGELCPPSSSSYWLEQTPKLTDVEKKRKKVDGETWDYLLIRLRCTKTWTESSLVELLPNRFNTAFCPVTAWSRWEPYLKGDKSCPIFTIITGSNKRFITARDLNNLLTVCLPSCSKIGTHSFRRYTITVTKTHCHH